MQTRITIDDNNVYWKTRKLGTIHPSESLFQSVPRTSINIFKMFNGLGLNEELLHILNGLNIHYIEIPFCSEVLKTTTNKWLTKGIPSPYCSDRVDQQLILPLNKINLEEIDTHKISSTQEQLSLWSA